MRRAQLVLLASMLTTAGATLAACGSDVSDTSGSGGGTTSSSSSSTVGSGGGGGIMDAGSDVDNGHPSKVYPAPHPPVPQVINCTGNGPVLQTPNVVPIFFPSDTLQPQLTDFVATLGATPYWPANVTEYGVGALTGLTPVVMTTPADANLTDDQVQAWLAQQIDAAVLPMPDANTLYAIFYQENTTISMSGGGQNSTSCHDFGGYHNNITYQGADVAYAVMPRCSDFDGLNGIDAVTAAASHEFIEAATDPFPGDQNRAAFCEVDNAHLYWLFALGGGETGDMCAQDLSSFTTFPPFPYTIQRAWSNLSAAQSHDPCVPIPAGNPAYFNSAPVLTDMLNILGQVTVPGKKIAEGATGVIEVDLFSDGDTGGPWTVDAQDLGQLMGQGHELDFEWDRNSGENGEKLHLSVTVEKASQYGAEIFFITSQKGGQQHVWVGIVGQ